MEATPTGVVGNFSSHPETVRWMNLRAVLIDGHGKAKRRKNWDPQLSQALTFAASLTLSFMSNEK